MDVGQRVERAGTPDLAIKAGLGARIGRAGIHDVENLRPAKFNLHARNADGDEWVQEGTTAVHLAVPTTAEVSKFGRIGANPADPQFFSTSSRYRNMLEFISDVHGIHPGRPLTPKIDRSRGIKQDQRPLHTVIEMLPGRKDGGGVFYPNGRMFRSGTRTEISEHPTIHIGRRRNFAGFDSRGRRTYKDVPNADVAGFAHEFGHRLDYIYDDRVPTNPTPTSDTAYEGLRKMGFQSGIPYSESTGRGMPEMAAFLDVAVNNEHFPKSLELAKTWGSVGGQPYDEYLSDAIEVWARAYEQWMTQKLEAEYPGAYEQLMSGPTGPLYLPTDYFNDQVAPRLEDVLRARGLM